MKQLIFLVFLFTNLSALAQVNLTVKWAQHIPSANSDTIYYNSTQKLKWPDFKGKPGLPHEALAVTSSGFGYMATMQYRNGKTNVAISVFCYFSKKSSWVRAGKESDYALTHEQHHFDVTYIVTNLFIEKLKTTKFTSNNYGQLLENLYAESCRELEKMQNEYDGQTKNGQLKNVQARWNEKIEKQLSFL
ncbi:hypothetical protein [Ferruginibacter sp.]|nr:hypothetical protein [Ferruginibacter sp.]